MTGERFMPVPGDVVDVRILEDGQALVERMEPREFTLERRSAGGRAKTMAANVDLLVTVTALAHPPPRLVTLDQLLAFAEIEGIAAAVVFTKPDLTDGVEMAALLELYRALEYPTIAVNPKLGENLEALRNLIASAARTARREFRGWEEHDFSRSRRRYADRRGFTLRPGSTDHDRRTPLPYRQRVPHR